MPPFPYDTGQPSEGWLPDELEKLNIWIGIDSYTLHQMMNDQHFNVFWWAQHARYFHESIERQHAVPATPWEWKVKRGSGCLQTIIHGTCMARRVA